MYWRFLIILIFFYSCNGSVSDGNLIQVAENPEKGFQYPYYLFVPEEVSNEDEIILIVEPNNSGFASDEFSKHLEKAKRIASREFYAGNFVARKLNFPLLVPVFPRSERQWQIYTHALDRDVMLQRDNPLERLDLQLLAMLEDATERLHEMGYNISDQFFLTGFSASGTFVNRFTALHPEKIKAAVAGGVNGLVFLPVAEMNDERLIYPIGTGDFQELFGKPFDLAAFRETPQFLFMGALDDNDAVPYQDAYDKDERELIYRTLGSEMLPARWENCRSIYTANGVRAQFKTYDGIGHEQTGVIKTDILKFFQSQLNHEKSVRTSD
jgi:hypothetical protein